MSVCKVLKFLSQKIGNFFGDFKDERELKKDPVVCRDITRLLCLLCLFGGLGYAFYRYFMDSPNLEVNRVYLQNENRNYAIQRQYNSFASYGTDIDAANITSGASTEQELTLDCPCTTTTISWTNYVHFYIINYTSSHPQPVIHYETDPFGNASMIYVPSVLNVENLSRDTVDLTIDKFCNNFHVTPDSVFTVSSVKFDCPAIVSALLTTKPQADNGETTNWNDPKASYFESPSLQTQKFLYSNTIQLLQAYVREQYTLQYTQQPYTDNNLAHRDMTLLGMIELWLYVLDRFSANSSSTDFDFFTSAANRSFIVWSELSDFYTTTFAVYMYEGQAYLGMNISWLEYYNACSPAYCDVTMKISTFRRALKVLAQVGGLWGVAAVVSKLIVWPVVSFLLAQFSTCCGCRGHYMRMN